MSNALLICRESNAACDVRHHVCAEPAGIFAHRDHGIEIAKRLAQHRPHSHSGGQRSFDSRMDLRGQGQERKKRVPLHARTAGSELMIARLWHGWTKPENANSYEKLLRTEILPGFDRVRGYNGAYLFREDGETETEVVTFALLVDIGDVCRIVG